MTTQQPDPLDEILRDFRKRCFEVRDLVYAADTDPQDVEASVQKLAFSIDQAKSRINALMIPRKEVEAAIPKHKNKSLVNPNNGSNNHAFRLGYNQAIADIRSALGMNNKD